MTGYDAALLAAGLALLADRPARWWLGALAPLVATVLGAAGAGTLAVPLAALVVCAARLPAAAPALLLLAAPHTSASAAALTGGTWLLSTWLAADVIATRVDGDALWWRLRGAPVRLLVVASLYAALAPLGHL